MTEYNKEVINERLAKIRDKANAIAITWKSRYIAAARAAGESAKKPAEITEEIEPQHDISNIRMISRDSEDKRQYYVTIRLRAAGDIVEAVCIAQDVHIGKMAWKEDDQKYIRMDTILSEVHQNHHTGIWQAVYKFYEEKSFLFWYDVESQINEFLNVEQADF